jgi:hypothetical protein
MQAHSFACAHHSAALLGENESGILHRAALLGENESGILPKPQELRDSKRKGKRLCNHIITATTLLVLVRPTYCAYFTKCTSYYHAAVLIYLLHASGDFCCEFLLSKQEGRLCERTRSGDLLCLPTQHRLPRALMRVQLGDDETRWTS